jgi:hypothetical protein
MRARRHGFEFANEPLQGVIVDGATVHVVSLDLPLLNLPDEVLSDVEG